VLIINDGRLVADDAPERLGKGEGGTVTVVLASRTGATLQSEAVRSVLERVAGVTGVELAEGEGSGTLGFRLRYGAEDIRRSLFEAAVRHELCLLEVKRQHVSLEETFRKLTGGEGPRAPQQEPPQVPPLAA
jgi:ABC-2 type transport system ATP-binding protein